MTVLGQVKIPLWDDVHTWERGLLSFKHLQRLLIRTSRSITVPSSGSKDGLQLGDEESKLELKLAHQREQEDDVVRRWLVFLPSSLTETRVWTKAFAGRANGERMAVWMPKNNYQWEVICNHPIKGEEVCGGDFI